MYMYIYIYIYDIPCVRKRGEDGGEQLNYTIHQAD